MTEQELRRLRKKLIKQRKSRRKNKGDFTEAEARIMEQSSAWRVIEKFGGVRRLCEALNDVGEYSWNPSSVYRWTYPREKGGTGGVIPTKALEILSRAARLHGIFLEADDFLPMRK